jgi:hypothetical protein
VLTRDTGVIFLYIDYGGLFFTSIYMLIIIQRLLSSIALKYGIYSVSFSDTDTWYLQVCKFIELIYRLHASYAKSIIERTM